MSGDVLSQAEVENLLSAMEAKPGGVPMPEMRMPEGAAAARGNEKVSPYDFKRPERVGKEQMRALQTLHEGFSRNLGAALSGLLRSIVEVKLTSVDQLTYSEFLFSLENPTCFNLLRADPLEGNLILDINPAILYPMIDRLLGGGNDPGPVTRRPLTEIELRLVSRITKIFLVELQSSWENVLKLDLSVERVESNPQLVQIVPPNEVVVLISFELINGDVRGMMNLCIPFNSIERIGQQLTANSWFNFSSKPPTPESMDRIGSQVQGSVVELLVELAATRINTRDLVGLKVGDIITTAKDKQAPLTVTVEGRPRFHAQPGMFKGHKAIQVQELLESSATASETDRE